MKMQRGNTENKFASLIVDCSKAGVVVDIVPKNHRRNSRMLLSDICLSRLERFPILPCGILHTYTERLNVTKALRLHSRRRTDAGNHVGRPLTCASAVLGFFFFIGFILPTFTLPSRLLAGDIKGKVTVVGGASNANAVVYVEYVDSTFVPPKKPAVMDQRHLAFNPAVLPILAGTTVEFLNSDVVLHDVFTPSQCAGSFNLGSFAPGKSRRFTFKSPGCFALILCDIHPEMQAWIVALQNPYYAVTDSTGRYVIRNLPAGKYILRSWYGYYRSQSVRIIIPESGSIEENFELKQ